MTQTQTYSQAPGYFKRLNAFDWLFALAIAGLAALLIGGHNALDGWHPGGPLWLALHERGYRPLADNFGIAVAYPLLQWHIKSTTKAQQGLYEYD
eukprot:gene2620-3398_t